ncbi:MAG: hypothetical protein GXX96_05030 [Planctomycetaceae bacterium]|nr:hypothetical protein [Planctomycetaceae bacterium]
MLLSHPDGSLLRLVAACYVHDPDETGEEAEKRRMGEFLARAFRGLNEVMYGLALSEDSNREIVDAAMRCLFEDDIDGEGGGSESRGPAE